MPWTLEQWLNWMSVNARNYLPTSVWNQVFGGGQGYSGAPAQNGGNGGMFCAYMSKDQIDAYQPQHGQTAVLFDQDNDVFYMKGFDNTGRPTVTIADYTVRAPENPVSDLQAQIAAMQDQIAALTAALTQTAKSSGEGAE